MGQKAFLAAECLFGQCQYAYCDVFRSKTFPARNGRARMKLADDALLSRKECFFGCAGPRMRLGAALYRRDQAMFLLAVSAARQGHFFAMSLITGRANECMLCNCVERANARMLRSAVAARFLRLACGHIYCEACMRSMRSARIRRCCFCRRSITVRAFRLIL